MPQSPGETFGTTSIEGMFFKSAVDYKGCSLEPMLGKELCPDYYKTLAAIADWHIVTIIFAVVISFMFLGLAFGKRD
jgi:hypothetical protein